MYGIPNQSACFFPNLLLQRRSYLCPFSNWLKVDVVPLFLKKDTNNFWTSQKVISYPVIKA
jgi:hypothetical protein